ncbi:hypothetical protein FBD94_18130 [Pedobacter hiemivivus]|uniref:Reverse transcriptase domain-containing protein n=1 Tax=Pedobacter hiemivivus TaxID=2530454 RepID=A0A4U1G5D3_9SPHI|nr:reverse transcriptase domain-containing protein [Pedobacter hiemivivus]TKC58534.1 hypothetical protein FBD94_18130 [Pedobacter hiemivivus]
MAKTRKYRLITQIANPAYLRRAWVKLNKSNKDSRGVSEETIADFSNSLESNLLIISAELKTRKYEFQSVRPVLVSKGVKDEFRPLRLADIRDRLVQKALAMKLEELLAIKYQLDNDCSFGYRPDKNVEDAVKKMVEYYKQGYHVILEADIKKFFDNVNRKNLLKKIFGELPDKTINTLLGKALAQSVGDLSNYDERHHHYFKDSMQGIPQGNALSPLLANIYLADFDQRMIQENFKLIRYADDFIVMCKDRNEAHRALSVAREEIHNKLGLELHPLPSPINALGSKTRIVNPIRDSFSFLSIRFDGKNIWVDPKKVAALITAINEVTDLSTYKNDQKYQGLITIFRRLKNLLEGWLSAFKYVDVDRDFREIDDHIDYKLTMTLLKMNFKLKSSNLRSKNLKSVRDEVQILLPDQRLNTGVPTCEKFVKSLKREVIKI